MKIQSLVLVRAFVAIFAAVSSVSASANDGAFLDKGFKNAERPIVDQFDWSSLEDAFSDIKPAKSPTAKALAFQTSVKSQGSRGTCSMFSAAAAVEAMLVIRGQTQNTVDLSEEWLDYLVARTQGDDGSTSTRNFGMVARYGIPMEKTWPYVGETWDRVNYSDLSSFRCGKLEGTAKEKACLFAHRDPRVLTASDEQLKDEKSELFDPEFVTIRDEAAEIRDFYLSSLEGVTSFRVARVSDVKALLDTGIPVTLDIDFYYGAWNHSQAGSLGIGRNMDHWSKGIVGYPEPSSYDYVKTQEDPAGHSVLVVGYDDSVEVTTKYLAEDGVTQKTATYKGVYYFKNSWGSHSFGSQAVIDGVPAPGYGMITQKYAHEYGGFYQFPL